MMIYTTHDLIKATTFENLLNDEKINVVLLNKAGTPYTIFQVIELYVHYTEAEKALDIIYKAGA